MGSKPRLPPLSSNHGSVCSVCSPRGFFCLRSSDFTLLGVNSLPCPWCPPSPGVACSPSPSTPDPWRHPVCSLTRFAGQSPRQAITAQWKISPSPPATSTQSSLTRLRIDPHRCSRSAQPCGSSQQRLPGAARSCPEPTRQLQTDFPGLALEERAGG